MKHLDLSVTDLCSDICGHVGLAPAIDIQVQMAVDPTRHEPLDSSFGVVCSHINCEEFA